MLDDFDDEAKLSSLPNLIAWLGLCLMSASWGRFMPAALQAVWGYVGLFGLAAGLGLDVVEQARLAQEEREQRRVLQLHQEQMLAKFVPHINAASHDRIATKPEGRP